MENVNKETLVKVGYAVAAVAGIAAAGYGLFRAGKALFGAKTEKLNAKAAASAA